MEKNEILLQGAVQKFSYDPSFKTDPFLQFLITPQDPCWEFNKLPRYNLKNFYPLLAKQAAGCGEYGPCSDVFNPLSCKLEMMDVYKYNEVSEYVSKLPYISNYMSPLDTLTLMVEKRVSQSSSDSYCHNLNYKQVRSAADTVAKMARWVKAFSIICLILSVGILVAAGVFFAIRKKATKKNPVKLIYILYGVILTFIMWGFFVSIYYNSGENSLKSDVEIYKQYLDKKCFDQIQINKALSTVEKYIHKS